MSQEEYIAENASRSPSPAPQPERAPPSGDVGPAARRPRGRRTKQQDFNLPLDDVTGAVTNPVGQVGNQVGQVANQVSQAPKNQSAKQLTTLLTRPEDWWAKQLTRWARRLTR